MKVLWICGLPLSVQEEAFGNAPLGARAAWSWVLGHLPPPEGVELHIACPVTKGPWNNKPVPYQGAIFHLVRFPPGRISTGSLFDAYRYGPLYNRLKPDVVHGWGTEDSHGNAARRLDPGHHVVQVQGLINRYQPYLTRRWMARYLAWQERRTLSKAGRVFVESRCSLEMTRPFCRPHAQIDVVDHPLRREFIEAPLPVDSAREPRVLFVGRLSSGKGYLDAVRAFAALPVEWRFDMVGGGTPEAIQALHETARALEVQARVEHIPYLSASELVRLMARATLFLLPSYMDTGPTALKEALAMGMWPVCYDNSGPKELIGRFLWGTLVPTGDVGALQDALCASAAEASCPGAAAVAVAQSARRAFDRVAVWTRLQALYAEIARRA